MGCFQCICGFLYLVIVYSSNPKICNYMQRRQRWDNSITFPIDSFIWMWELIWKRVIIAKYRTSLYQCPMSINSDQCRSKFWHCSKCRSIPIIADQCRSIPLNFYQFRSMPDQAELIRHWSTLIVSWKCQYFHTLPIPEDMIQTFTKGYSMDIWFCKNRLGGFLARLKWTDLQSTAIWLGMLMGMLGLEGCSQNLRVTYQNKLSSRTTGQLDKWTNGL